MLATWAFPSVYGMTTILIALAALCFAIYRQMRATPVSADRAFFLPVVLVVLGVVQGGLTGSPSAALLAIEILVAVMSGLLRGVTVRLWRDAAGVLWRQGTVWTVLAWIASIGARVALILPQRSPSGFPISAGTLLIFLGVSLATQAAYVTYRARAESFTGRAKVQV